MNESITTAEALVRELDKARAEADRLDGARRSLRLGRKVEQTRRGLFRWRAGAYGGGWFNSLPEALELGPDLEREFYTFLGERRDAANRRVCELESRLAAIEVTR